MGKYKIIYTSGSFDLFHEGHLNILLKAKKLGDTLIVGVSTNRLIKEYKHMTPIVDFKGRKKILEHIKEVDIVIDQDTFFDVDQLRPLGIEAIVLGDDWKGKSFPELEQCLKELNIKMLYVPYTKKLSSSKIKEKIIRKAIPIIQAQTKRK